MVLIAIVTGAYKPTYNWGGATLYNKGGITIHSNDSNLTHRSHDPRFTQGLSHDGAPSSYKLVIKCYKPINYRYITSPTKTIVIGVMFTNLAVLGAPPCNMIFFSGVLVQVN